MDRENLGDDFEFYQEAFINQQINAEWFFEGVPLLFNGNNKLLYGWNTLEKQFTHQALFIDRLNKSRTFKPMDFDGRSDDYSAQLIRALKFRVHSVWKRKSFYRRKRR